MVAWSTGRVSAQADFRIAYGRGKGDLAHGLPVKKVPQECWWMNFRPIAATGATGREQMEGGDE